MIRAKELTTWQDLGPEATQDWWLRIYLTLFRFKNRRIWIRFTSKLRKRLLRSKDFNLKVLCWMEFRR